MRKTEKKVEFVKKKAIMLLLAAAVIGSLCACGAGSETAPPAETAATVEPATETTVEAAPDETAETEPTVVEGDLFLKASSVTFSLVGEPGGHLSGGDPPGAGELGKRRPVRRFR